MNRKSSAIKDRTAGRRISTGLILNALMKFSAYITKTALRSVAALVMTSYDRVSAALSEWRPVARIRRRIAKSRSFHGLSISLSRLFDKRKIVSVRRRLIKAVLSLPLVSYGVFLFSFGLGTVIIYMLKEYAITEADGRLGSLIAGLSSIIISIFLVSSKLDMSGAILGSRLLNFILVDILSLRRERFEIEDPEEDGQSTPERSVFIPLLIGLIPGLLTYFAPAEYMMLGLFLLILLYMIMTSPESGIILTVLLLPFLPTMYLAGLVGITAIALFLKLIRGKRVIKFTLLDFTVILFCIVTSFGYFLSADMASSLKPVLLMLGFLVAYFLVKNLMRSTDLAMKSIKCMAFSGFIVSLYGIYQFFFTQLETTWQDNTLFADLEGRVVSTFENPNVLGEYLIVIIPVTLALMLSREKKGAGFLYLIMLLADALCLGFTYSRGAWLGIVLGILFFILFSGRYSLAGIVCGGLAVPFLTLLLPSNVTLRFSSILNFADTSTTYRINIWRGVVNMIKDNLIVGVGIGEGAFGTVYRNYSLPGIEAAPHSHSLYLQIWAENGIIGLFIFVLFVFVLYQMIFSFIASPYTKNGRMTALGLAAGLTAILAQGFTDYIFYNYRVFLFFWMTVGLIRALVYAQKSEAVYNEYVSEETFFAN